MYKILANEENTRAIMVNEDGDIIKSFGFANVLCCYGPALAESEGLTETDKCDFDWVEEV